MNPNTTLSLQGLRKLLLVAAFAGLVLGLLLHTTYGGDVSEFQKKARTLSKKIKSAKKQHDAYQERFCELHAELERRSPLNTNDPEVNKLIEEHNKVRETWIKLQEQLAVLRNRLVNEINSFLQANTCEVVKAAIEVFYKAKNYPDAFAETALLERLKAITNEDAIGFMLDELRKSRRKNARVLICQVIADRKEKRFVNTLIDVLGDNDWDVVVAAAKALTCTRTKAAVGAMIEAYERASERKNEGAMRGLRQELRYVTGQYMLETALDFRNWWDGSGKQEYDENALLTGRGLMGKKGPKTSLVYGRVTSKSVIFVCDVSHSMKAKGVVPETPEGEDGSGKKSGDDDEESPETGGDLAGGKKEKPRREKKGLGRQGVKPGFEGSRIEILKIELAHVVRKMLPDDANFNLITYATEVQSWKKNLAKASESNKNAAIKFVKDMKPLGMTNAYGALEKAFADKSVDTIYFLSDGNPTTGDAIDPNEILRAVQRWNQGRNVVIHTIGLLVGKYDDKENHDKLKQFLRYLADENGGQCRIFED